MKGEANIYTNRLKKNSNKYTPTNTSIMVNGMHLPTQSLLIIYICRMKKSGLQSEPICTSKEMLKLGGADCIYYPT